MGFSIIVKGRDDQMFHQLPLLLFAILLVAVALIVAELMLQLLAFS